MNNLLDAFTSQGTFDAELWYTVLYNEIPSKYSLAIENETKHLNPNEITFDKCKHLFEDVIAIRSFTDEVEYEEDAEEIDVYEIEETLIPVDSLSFASSKKVGSLYIAVKNKRVYIISYNRCTVYYSSDDNLEEIKKFITTLWDCFPRSEPEEKTAKVGLIRFSNGEYYTTFSDIKKTTINIEENYNDDFQPVYKDIVDFLHQRESGLILAWGLPGSGNFYKNNLEF